MPARHDPITNRRVFLRAGIALAAAASVSPSAAAAYRPLRLGAVLPFSGALARLGHQAKIGLDLALAEINASGGLLGTPVELIYQDNRSEAAASVERTLQLIGRDRALAVIGPIGSDAREAMMATHRRLRTPLLYAAHDDGGACDRYGFFFGTTPNQEVGTLVPALMHRAGNRVFLLGTDDAWSRKVLERTGELVRELGGTVAAIELVPGASPDFVPNVRRIDDSGAAVLLTALPGADGDAFVAQAAALGLAKRIAIGFCGFVETASRATQAGWDAGIWVAVPFTASIDDAKVRDFVARVRRMAGNDVTISHYVITHYNALKALHAAAGRSGSIDRESLVQGLEGLEVTTPSGTTTIGMHDHRASAGMYLALTGGDTVSLVQSMGNLAPRARCAKI